MWKPGNKKPDGPNMTPGLQGSQGKSPKNPSSAVSSRSQAVQSLSPPQSAKKRLSGATMNMKFMKRKKEMMQNEEKRAAVTIAAGGTFSNGIATSVAGNSKAATWQATPLQEATAMDVDQSLSTKSDGHVSGGRNNSVCYAQVTSSVDMYGMQAALLGRRSFGGFNAAIERAYSNSKGSIENRTIAGPRGQKISDEELLERYKEIAMSRDDNGRGVGNLDHKVKKRKRQGLR